MRISKAILISVVALIMLSGCSGSVKSNFTFTEENAKGILIAYFTALHDKEYEKAAIFQDSEDEEKAAAFLKKACETGRYICLSVHGVLGSDELSDHEYVFRILFRTEDGGVYVAPGRSIQEGGLPEYEYRVKKTSQGVIVIPGQDN